MSILLYVGNPPYSIIVCCWNFFKVVPRTSSILHAWRRSIGWSIRTVDHVSFYQIMQVFIELRTWYLHRNFSINIIKCWIFVRQSMFLEFYCIHVYSKKKKELIIEKVWCYNGQLQWLMFIINLNSRKLSSHAITLPNLFFLFKYVNSCSNLILNTLPTMASLSTIVKFIDDSIFCTWGQFGLLVKVRKRSGRPTLLQIVIPSKYNWSMYLCLPTKDEGNITRLPLFDLCLFHDN